MRMISPGLIPAIALLLPMTALAKQARHYDFVLTPPAIEASDYSAQGRVAAVTRVPQALYGLSVPVLPGTPEAMARDYLSRNAAALQLNDVTLGDLAHLSTRSGATGHNVRFEQRLAGVPVYASRTVVHISPDHRVSFVTSGYRPDARLASVQPLISAEQARAVLIERLQARAPFNVDQVQLNAYSTNDATRLAWRVWLTPASPAGSWEAQVDATTGEIVVLWDIAAYASGSVFDPDPLSSSGTQYDGAISDKNDSDYEAINKQIVIVDLGDLLPTNGLYYLSSEWAELIDHEAPNEGLFEQASPDFLFTREQNGFESTLTFFHIQQSMRYINETLGIALRPYQYEGGVQFDPQGLNGDDNSHYTPGTGQLAFGEGCVDDDEDADVVLHELGHGLHDWITDGGLSNMVDGLSEGFGDYWAQSYSRSLGQWAPTAPEYQWVFNWDGHNECWAGRVTNVALPYPALVQPGLTVHAGGQHWSTCLMQIYDQIGRDKTDRITLEGLAMTGTLSSQNDAANAVLQAASDLNFSAEELQTISSTFGACGYVMGAPSLPPLLAASGAAKAQGRGLLAGAVPLSLLLSLGAVAFAGGRRRLRQP